jgi:hypothetical protein
MTTFASPGLGWGSRGELNVCGVVFLIILFFFICAVTLILHRASHDAAVRHRREKRRIKERDQFFASMQNYLDKLSDEQRAALMALWRSGRRSEAVQEAARFLTVSEESASRLDDELQREQ